MEIFTIPKSGFSKLWKFQKMVFRRRFVGERERTSTNRALISKTVCHFLLLKMNLSSLLCAIPKWLAKLWSVRARTAFQMEKGLQLFPLGKNGKLLTHNCPDITTNACHSDQRWLTSIRCHNDKCWLTSINCHSNKRSLTSTDCHGNNSAQYFNTLKR